LAAVDAVARETHEIDRDALRVWFAIWPELVRELTAPGEDQQRRLQFFQMNGGYRLEAKTDSSHRFLYGHRYWPAIKRAMGGVKAAERWERLQECASASGAPRNFGLAMAAIAQMTLEQCGPDFLKTAYEPKLVAESPEEMSRRRARSGKPSLLARLTGAAGGDRVVFDEQKPEAWFPILATQEITTAAEADKRPYHEQDERCYEGMGPIPVDCRSGSCGTCWVGVIGGNANLDPVEEFERKRMEYFGYWDSGFVDGQGERPLVRLACQARANGSVTIVIPPWNGVFGRSRRERELGD
jgi:ferredoxin